MSTIVLDCLAEGFPVPKVSWFFDGRNVDGPGSRIVSNGSLILSADRDRSGPYSCSVSNGIGDNLIANISLRVLGKVSVVAIEDCGQGFPVL